MLGSESLWPGLRAVRRGSVLCERSLCVFQCASAWYRQARDGCTISVAPILVSVVLISGNFLQASAAVSVALSRLIVCLSNE